MMRNNNRDQETAELVVQDIDEEERTKFNIGETRQDFTVEDDTLEDEEEKECKIF